MNWRENLLNQMKRAVQATGGWGYARSRTSSSAPTVVACLALTARDSASVDVLRGLRFLASMQRSDGSVPIHPALSSPAWPTGLAVLAWIAAKTLAGGEFGDSVRAAVSWLLALEGVPFRSDRAVHGHDTTLVGWPWVKGTHSWVEPTAYALLALRAAGRADHPRAREAVRLLLDRQLPEGGWNYGNTKILGNTLRPFPGPTGVALCALQGETRQEEVASSVKYLERELQRIRAPMSLGWGLIGLNAWARPEHGGEPWLNESAARLERWEIDPLAASLLLLADGPGFATLLNRVPATHG